MIVNIIVVARHFYLLRTAVVVSWEQSLYFKHLINTNLLFEAQEKHPVLWSIVLEYYK
jgi:hypothetical protein